MSEQPPGEGWELLKISRPTDYDVVEVWAEHSDPVGPHKMFYDPEGMNWLVSAGKKAGWAQGSHGVNTQAPALHIGGAFSTKGANCDEFL